MPLSVLVVDAAPAWREHVRTVLEFLEYDVQMVAAPDDSEVITEEFSAVMVSRGDSDLAFHETVNRVRRRFPDTPLILLDPGDGQDPLSAEILEMADTVVELPLRHRLILAMRRRLIPRQQAVAVARRAPQLFRSLVGDSAPVVRVLEQIDAAARTDAPILILGEAGTGKEVAARKIHYFSSRRKGPFVAVDGAERSDDDLESELFGLAPTPEQPDGRAGKIELAAGGTLFLHEIGQVGERIQSKLLRVIQDKAFERAGSRRWQPIDVRIMAGGDVDVPAPVAGGTPRTGLYEHFRENSISMPALRDRRGDIPKLVDELVRRVQNERRVTVRFSRAAMEALGSYPWPGNLAELTSLVERVAVLMPNSFVDVYDLPAIYTAHVAVPAPGVADTAPSERVTDPASLPRLPREGLDIKEHLNTLEYTLIKQALEEAGGVVAHAAERLHLRRTTLVEKLRKYGISRGSDEASGF